MVGGARGGAVTAPRAGWGGGSERTQGARPATLLTCAAPLRPPPRAPAASEYQTLARILQAVAEARIALLSNHTQKVGGRGWGNRAEGARGTHRPAGASSRAEAACPRPLPGPSRAPRRQAVDHLEEAVALEDGLGYMEPPRAHSPTRQCLGWALLQAGRLADAAEVYQQVRGARLAGRCQLLGFLGACDGAAA
jgi:hypothetical protein